MFRRVVPLCAALAATGCAAIPDDVARVGEASVPAELRETPFYPQERYQCGPAALATVLDAGGVTVDLGELVDRVYLPGREGSLQVELLAATRRAGRIPYRIDGRLAAVAAELSAGRPVLVLQNLGVSWYPRWHYAVVVGLDTADDLVVLRSGTDRRRETRRMTFLRTWRRGEYWAVVALEPGTLPAGADSARYLRAVADFENAGQAHAALPAWQAATRAWPESGTAWFGLGNVQLGRDEFGAAEAAYRRALAVDPALWAAANNLAFAVAGQGRTGEAIAVLEAALTNVTDSAAQAEIRDSLREFGVRD
jgi:tetratricopeptide (TPR) repeat protein